MKSAQDASNQDLYRTLQECKTYAARGQSIANNAVSSLSNAVKKISDSIQKEITNLEHSKLRDESIKSSLTSQLSSIQSNFLFLPQMLSNDIKSISKNSLSITLFGRTMAGKSTLMEILTHGDGASIGSGAQRTTRDVRTYTYKGLQITDVPGIAAFEGKEDEDVAFTAAQKSDLILFLITNDAPQDSEARCLSRIVTLGKPVICLINIKVDLNNGTNIKLFKRDLQKKFDGECLNELKQQFINFGVNYGQDWSNISFAYVHLKSAYLSMQKEFRDISEELYYLSRFDYVEKLIINEVIKNGKFYKLKAFTEIVAVPVMHASETLFEQSAQNSMQGSILIQKRRKLKEWTDRFEADSKTKIESLLTRIANELKGEIASFAEDNYNNTKASGEWNKILKQKNIEKRATELLQQLCNKCEEELSEICREINAEIKFSHSVFSDRTINMSKLIDGRRIWGWATNIMSAGLAIAGLFVSGPLGWASMAVGLIGLVGSFFFKNSDEKNRDARLRLEKKLSSHIDTLIANLEKKMLDVLYNDLLKKQLYPMKHTIDSIVNSVFTLSKTQQEYAVLLNKKLQTINTNIVKEALIYSGYSGLEWHIDNIVRIPGFAMMIILEDGKRIPSEASRALADLFKEKVWFVFKKENIKSMLFQAIGKHYDTREIRVQYIDSIPRIIHIPSLKNTDEYTKKRIRMAQQITELLIME